ncbi:MAG: hypothetical protein ACE5JQ_13015 [Candidatus Methylomirabilales bacterium]
MGPPERKKWDPNCPKCQAELQRYVDLSETIFDEVNHGAGVQRLPPEDYCCNHESEQQD